MKSRQQRSTKRAFFRRPDSFSSPEAPCPEDEAEYEIDQPWDELEVAYPEAGDFWIEPENREI